MPRERIDQLLELMDRAFESHEHSLIVNLRSVRDESWSLLPENASRSIRNITAHLGLFKFIYANHAFRGADMGYGDPPATPDATRLQSTSAAMEWLREAHAYLTGCIGELQDDEELDAPRKAHWGEFLPTYDLIVIMLEHDLYHAGEINRTRALLQHDDKWDV